MSRAAAIVPWRCHICAREFSELQGGLCRACGRVTCSECWGDKGPGFMPRPVMQRQCKTCAQQAGLGNQPEPDILAATQRGGIR